MKKLILGITAIVISLVFISCPDDSDNDEPVIPNNPDEKTIIVFDNTYGICTVLVYDDYRRRETDKIVEIPAGRTSDEVEYTPSASTPFYFTYSISLIGVSGFAVDFVPEVGKDQKAVRIDAGKKTVIPIPVLDDAVSSQQQVLSSKSHLTVQNNSAYSFQLYHGVSMIRPDNSPDSGVVNSYERAPYTINPGRSSDYRLLVGADYKPFPDTPERFEAGNFYSYQYTGSVSLDTQIPITLDNMNMPTYSVSFSANGGSGTVPAAQIARAASGITLPLGSGLTNGDKVFGGWGEDASGSSVVYSAGTTYTITRDIILYAKWYPAGALYTVTFNSAGGKATASQSMVSGALAVRPPDPYRAGYTFTGWCSDAGGQNPYDFETPVTKSFTLYAAWDANRYTVTFNANGADGTAPDAITADYGSSITLPTAGGLSKPDEPFLGWNTEDDGTGTAYASGAQYTVIGDVTLFAVWDSAEQPPDNLIEMVWVQGGSFQMGSNSIVDSTNVGPQHMVTLNSFFIGKYQITNVQYEAIMGSNPSYFTGNYNYPVEQVTWYDTVEFCNKLSIQDGLETVYTITNRTPASGYPITSATVTADWSKNGYRLPTEAEWEYAARGGNGSPGNYTYSGSNNVNEVAWHAGNSGNTIHAVGTKVPNGLGIYDMSGNVFEWCWDWMAAYTGDMQTNPVGASNGDRRVQRGGSWNASGGFPSVSRGSVPPSDYRSDWGFRLARGVIDLSGQSDPTTVTSGADSGPGTLRYAIENAPSGSTITIQSSVGTIALTGRLSIRFKSLTIEGNGVTITQDTLWTTVDSESQLMYVQGFNTDIVNISRIHFKDGRAAYSGAAIKNSGNLTLESCIFSGNQTSDNLSDGGAIYSNSTITIKSCTFYENRSEYQGGAIWSSGTLTLESCIFSGNQTSSTISGGGAIYSNGTITIKGCTFYENHSVSRGGAIWTGNATLSLIGNLFYGNTSSVCPVVYNSDGTVTSRGFNVVDVPFGTGSNQAGWPAVIGDKTISELPFSTTTFRLLPGSGAANVITTRPVDYPTVDFYGNPIPASGAAAGAVQATVNGNGYLLDLTVNDASRGTVNTLPVPNQDGLFTGTVTLTASANTGYEFSYWLVDGEQSGSANTLTLTMSKHTKVQAAFGRVVLVTNFNDDMYSETTVGTLRNALANMQDWDIIRFSGVTPGTSTIALYDALPQITKNITIEGNGITLSRSASWTVVGSDSLLSFSSSGMFVNVSRIHFKNGKSNSDTAAAVSNSGIMIMESCIFSDNQGNHYWGGTVSNSGTLTIKGCTFYGNKSTNGSGGGGAIYSSGNLSLIGNLFFGNTATYHPVLYYWQGTVVSNGYNVVDVGLGEEYYQAGWEAAPIDTTFSDLGITGDPINTATFAPVSGLGSVIPNPPPQGFPVTDFYGNTRTFPGAPGAVR